MPIPSTISFYVNGVAKPAGSKRAFAIRKAGIPTGRIAIIDDNKNSRDWKNDVKSAAIEAARKAGVLGNVLTGPLKLEVVFYMPRPKGHYGSGKKSGDLKASAPKWPATKPDATKLLRGVEDAITNIIWRDDAQIVQQHVVKCYADAMVPCAHIFITCL